VPVLGPALALKEMLLAGHPANFRWELIIPALATTFGYSALAMWWGLRQFERESIVFREAEEFSVGLWLRRQLTLPRVLPRPGDAAFLFTLCLAGFWFVGVLLSLFVSDPITATAMSQALLLLLPTIGYAVLLRGTAGLSLRRTFSLRLSRAWTLVFVPLAAAAALVLVHAAARLADDAGWLPVPARAAEEMQKLIAGVPLWLRVLVFAVSPAVCEELLCRGFLLSGLRGTAAAPTTAKAVVASSIMFGLLHFLGTPLQMAYAAALGLILGRLLVRTGSIAFPMLFHLTFNGLSVSAEVLLRGAPEAVQKAFAAPGAGVAALAAAVLIVSLGVIEWAFRGTPAEPAAIPVSPSTTPGADAPGSPINGSSS
jgi:sodium transport system permease protein